MADVVLEPPHDPQVQGMPTGNPPPITPPAPPQEPPPQEAPPDYQPEFEGDDGTGLGEEPEPPQQRRTIVGDLVREREQRRIAEAQAQSATELVRSVMALPGGMELLQRASGAQPGPAAPDAAALAAQQQQERAELEAVAVDLGLYTADNQPDLATAQRIVQRQSRVAERAVQQALSQFEQQHVQPLVQTRSEQIIAHVTQVAQQYGIDPELVANGMRTLAPEQIANPQAQQAVLMTALGIQTFGAQGIPPQGRQPGNGQQPPQPVPMQPPVGPPRNLLRPPILTEPSGGRPRNAPQLDDAFRARLRESGLQDAEINASLDRFVPGAPNRLE